MKQRKRVGLFILLLLIIAAVIYGFWPKPVPVDTAGVLRGPLQVTVEEEGKTRVVDRYTISTPISGFVRRIDLEAGDPVARGQILASIEPPRPDFLDPRRRAEAEARVSGAIAALRGAEEDEKAAVALAEYAEKELQRLREMFESDYLSESELDKAKAEARQARARQRSAEYGVRLARFELDAARSALEYSVTADLTGDTRKLALLSPIDGRVFKIYQESEGMVTTGQMLMEIGDPNTLEVEVDLLSADAVRITNGTSVFFNRWGGADTPTLQGRVRVVEPSGFTKVSSLGVEEQRVLVITDIVSPHETWDRLGDGYRVEAVFIIWKGENILQIPTSALFRYDDRWAVFIIKEHRAHLREVQVGHRSGLKAEVISGLNEGDRVIVHPSDAIEDGIRIQLR